MEDKEEEIILKWLKENFDYEKCFRPAQIHPHIKDKITNEDTVVTICRRLHGRELIDEITQHPNDSRGRESCYRISKKGLDELNPRSRDKMMFKFAIIGMAAAIVAAITSIISIFT